MTRVPCPACTRQVYGAFDTPGAFHDQGCPLPDYCPECKRPKGRGFELCRACHRVDIAEREAWYERKRGIEERERAVLTGAQTTTCYACGEEGTEENPLGLYGPNKTTSHYGCFEAVVAS